jgi:hypothetical protein
MLSRPVIAALLSRIRLSRIRRENRDLKQHQGHELAAIPITFAAQGSNLFATTAAIFLDHFLA